MSNVLAMPLSRQRLRAVPDAAAALADLATRVAQISHMQFQSKRDMQQAIVVLDLANIQARQLIEQIDDDARKAPLLAHSDGIRELVEIVRRKVAEL